MRVILLSIICTIAIISCDNMQKREILGNVKSVKVLSYDASGNIGELMPEKLVQTLEYNGDGQLIKESLYDSGEKQIALFKFKYDYRGRIKEKIAYDNDGSTIHSTVFEYPFFDIILTNKSSSSYYKNLTSINKYNNEGKQTTTLSWGPSHKQLTKISVYDNDGNIEATYTNKYTKFDDKNNWILMLESKNDEVINIVAREITYR